MTRTQRRRSRRRFAAFVAAYVVIAVAGLATLRDVAKYEWFPFSAWPLFMVTPADGPVYELAAESDKSAEWVYNTNYPERNSIELAAIVQALGAAIEKDRPKRRDELVRQIGRRYVPDTFRIYRLPTDVVGRYQTRLIERPTEIARFRTTFEDSDGEVVVEMLPLFSSLGPTASNR